MTEELRGHLQAAEQTNDLKDMRLHLAILERSQLYFSVEDWQRYQALAKRFHQRIMELFGASMGS